MTAASKFVKRNDEIIERPTKRTCLTKDGDALIVELYDRRIVIRPKGCKRGGPAERSTTPGLVFQKLMTPGPKTMKAKKRRYL